MTTDTVQGYQHPVIKAYFERAGRPYDVNETTCAKCHASNGQVEPEPMAYSIGKSLLKPTVVTVTYHVADIPPGHCSLRLSQDHMHLTCTRCRYEWWRRPKDAVSMAELNFEYALRNRWPHSFFVGPPPEGHDPTTCERCVPAGQLAEQAEAAFVKWIEEQP